MASCCPSLVTPRRWLSLLASGALLVALPPAVSAQRAMLERVVKTTTLPNGLQVIVVEGHDTPTSTIEVVARSGSIAQATPADEGNAHLFEHMLFKSYRAGSDNNTGWGQAAGALSAAFNGFTIEEAVGYFVSLPSANLDGGARIMSQLVRDPIFSRDDVNREGPVVINEFQRLYSDPRFHLQNEVQKRLWGSGWSRKNTLGTSAAILAANPASLSRTFSEFYVPNNAALIISGDATAAQANEAARKHFSKWPRKPDPFATHPIAAPPPLDRNEAVVVTADVGSVTILMAWQGPSVGTDSDDVYAASVLADAANETSSKFQTRLVASGLWHEVSLDYQPQSHVGPFQLSATTSADLLDQAMAALEHELRSLDSASYFTASELTDLKARRVVQTALALEEPEALAQVIAQQWSLTGNLDYFLGRVDGENAQGPEALRAFAHRYITTQPRVIGAICAPSSVTLVKGALGTAVARAGSDR